MRLKNPISRRTRLFQIFFATNFQTKFYTWLYVPLTGHITIRKFWLRKVNSDTNKQTEPQKIAFDSHVRTPSDKKTKFGPLIIQNREVPRVHLRFSHFTTFHVPEFFKVRKFSWNRLKLCRDNRISLSLGYQRHIFVLLHSLQDHLRWFGNPPCWIEIIWNFPRITESLPFDEKTKFGQLMTQYKKVPRVHLWTMVLTFYHLVSYAWVDHFH